MSSKKLFEILSKPGSHYVAVQSSSVESISGNKELADFLRRCANQIELGEWPFGNNGRFVEADNGR